MTFLAILYWLSAILYWMALMLVVGAGAVIALALLAVLLLADTAVEILQRLKKGMK